MIKQHKLQQKHLHSAGVQKGLTGQASVMVTVMLLMVEKKPFGNKSYLVNKHPRKDDGSVAQIFEHI